MEHSTGRINSSLAQIIISGNKVGPQLSGGGHILIYEYRRLSIVHSPKDRGKTQVSKVRVFKTSDFSGLTDRF